MKFLAMIRLFITFMCSFRFIAVPLPLFTLLYVGEEGIRSLCLSSTSGSSHSCGLVFVLWETLHLCMLNLRLYIRCLKNTNYKTTLYKHFGNQASQSKRHQQVYWSVWHNITIHNIERYFSIGKIHFCKLQEAILVPRKEVQNIAEQNIT